MGVELKHKGVVVPAWLTDALLLLGCALLIYMPLFSGTSSMKWDATDIYLPWKCFISECLRAGEFPLWNPYINLGFKQYGDPGTWYPLSQFIGILRPYDLYSLHAEFVLHIFIAGMGARALGLNLDLHRKAALLLAISYMFSGFMLSNAQHIGWIISAAWLPFVLVQARNILRFGGIFNSMRLGLLCFLMFTGGYPGIFVVTCYFLLFMGVLYCFRQYKAKSWAGVWHLLGYSLLAALCFTVFSLGPIYSLHELSQYITRHGGLSLSDSLVGSFMPKAMISLLAPYAVSVHDFGFWGEDFSMLNIYIGAFSLVLISIGIYHPQYRTPRFRNYVLISVVFLLASMGIHSPIRSWLYEILPFMNQFRFPALFRLFFIFFSLLAASAVFSRIIARTDSMYRFRIVFISWLVFYFILSASYLFLGQDKVDQRAAIQLFIVDLGFAVYFYFAWKYKDQLELGYRAVLVFVVCNLFLATGMNFYATIADDTCPVPSNAVLIQHDRVYDKPSTEIAMRYQNDSAFDASVPYLWKSQGVYLKRPATDGYNPYRLKAHDSLEYYGYWDSMLQFPWAYFTPNANGLNSLQIMEFKPGSMRIDARVEEATELRLACNYDVHWQLLNGDKPMKINTYYQSLMSVKLEPGCYNLHFSYRPKWFLLFMYVNWFLLGFGCVVLAIDSLFRKRLEKQ
jgi:hypothetical protein